jgi:hypothetical protein
MCSIIARPAGWRGKRPARRARDQGNRGLTVWSDVRALLRGVWNRVSSFRWLSGSQQPTPIQVRYQDGEPVEFERRPRLRPETRFLVTDVRERWIEPSPWPFPSPMPVGGDQMRCWRVVARSAGEPEAPEREFVLRMRAGPGVWDVQPAGERPGGEGG